MANTSEAATPINATCHCGAVRVQAAYKPLEITECQRTLCRRHSTAWAYYKPNNVEISIMNGGSTSSYIWGDREVEIHFCTTCGCVTHWTSLVGRDKMGVNSRLMDSDEVEGVNRLKDYRMLMLPFGSKEVAHSDDKAQY